MNKIYKNIALYGKPPTIPELLKDYEFPFDKNSVILSPQKPDSYIKYSLYQTVLVTKHLLTKALGNKYNNDYYKNFETEFNVNFNNKRITYTDKNKYIMVLKSKEIMEHLYYNDFNFILSRRNNYKYYIDKFKNNEKVYGIVQVEVDNKKWIVYEGNHRAIAQYDLGFKQMLCEVKFDYHKIFEMDYPFLQVW